MDPTDDTILKATIAGARSIVVGGWMSEECESAALERLVRNPCLTSTVAYRQGKLAAIDELRFLTHFRRTLREHTISVHIDKPMEDSGFSAVLDRIECERILNLCSPRVKEILTMVMDGASQEEVAKRLRISPSRISQLISRDAHRVRQLGHRSKYE